MWRPQARQDRSVIISRLISTPCPFWGSWVLGNVPLLPQLWIWSCLCAQWHISVELLLFPLLQWWLTTPAFCTQATATLSVRVCVCVRAPWRGFLLVHLMWFNQKECKSLCAFVQKERRYLETVTVCVSAWSDDECRFSLWEILCQMTVNYSWHFEKNFLFFF